MSNKTIWIDVVDEDGDLLLSIQPHWLPAGSTVEDLVRKILPGLSEMYEYKCYYTAHEEENIIH